MSEQRTIEQRVTGEVRTIENAARLTALMAEDDALWSDAVHIETAYAQQALRFLTRYIEGEWGFQETYDALKEMQP